jgi:hypothetical protein
MREEVANLHRQAMSMASAGYIASMQGKSSESLKFRRKAYALEREAALKLLTKTKAEPTRSVLFRSAATLALDCGDMRESERLVAMGLSGDPPPEIAEELRDVLERVYFDRHLAVRGVVLEPNDLQMSLAGNGVGLGAANIEDIMPRAQAVEKAYHRLVERKRKKQFHSYIDRTVQRQNPVHMTIPRAASFAVSFQIGRQLNLPMPIAGDTSDLIKELIDCFSLYEQGDELGLHNIIRDDAYYNNFVGLARQIVPDGSNVALVGFAFEHGGNLHKVSLTKRNTNIGLVDRTDEPRQKREQADLDSLRVRVSVEGMLLFANSETRKKNTIHLVEVRGGKKHVIIVPTGTMSDIVRPLWGRLVRVDGYRTRNGIVLTDVREVEGILPDDFTG